jgi:hypothetical protein
VEASFYVVDGIDDTALGAPEGVVEDSLVVEAHAVNLVYDVELVVHFSDRGCRGGGLIVLDVVATEQELTAEVRHLNCVVIGDDALSITGDTH